ncbi:hypothetical protein ACIP5N_21955 [Streptomyces sp. NPDC088768]|uniref:hypothetical protein n=1 Tax=Streptomyces sp. NPDC088768 TaxID=3365894 RepID=UPI0038264229
MTKAHARKNKARRLRERIGAAYTSAAAGTLHDHPLIDLAPAAASPTPEDVDQHQLAEMRGGLHARGIPDTLIWPELDDLRELHDDLTGLLEISGEALAAANHLALAAADRLAARKRTTA